MLNWITGLASNAFAAYVLLTVLLLMLGVLFWGGLILLEKLGKQPIRNLTAEKKPEKTIVKTVTLSSEKYDK